MVTPIGIAGSDPPPGSDLPDRCTTGLEMVETLIDAELNAPGALRSEAEQIDRIARLQRLRTKVEALQSAESHEFALAHAASRTANGQVDPERLERSICSQIGMACRSNPYDGRKRMRMGRDLRRGLDRVRALFEAGELAETRVAAIVAGTAYLDADERAEVDRLLSERDIAGMSLRQLRNLVRSLAAQVAPATFAARCRAARSDRRVTVRPAADGMAELTAHLPAEQAVACYAALRKAFDRVQVDPAPLTRSRGQVMADTLVERVTGRETAEHVDLAVQILVPVEAIVDPASPLPAEIPGHGPVPVNLLSTGEGRRTWRRLTTSRGIVIGGESLRRTFTGYLAELIHARDGQCSEPYCDSPVRQIDHIQRARDGGRTDFLNGRNTCQFHNLVREMDGWSVERTPDGVRTVTPTGHVYLSTVA